MKNLTIERLTFWILFILLFAMAVSVPVDTDTWWHIRAGETILDDGKIPHEDTFSHTRSGAEWIDHGWGGQVVMALAYRATGGGGSVGDGGVIGLALFTAIMGTGGMAIIYKTCTGNVYSRAFVMVFGMATAAAFWAPRPQMFSFFFSTVAYHLLGRYRKGTLQNLWAFPLMMVLWVNLHAGFAIGFIFLILFMLGEAIENILNPESALGWTRLRHVLLVTVVSVAALALNPYGPRMIAYPLETAELQTLNLFIQEWGSPDFKMPQTWAFVILLLSSLGFAGATTKRMAWSDLTLVTGSALLALWASRNIAVFAVTATPFLTHLVDEFLTERGWNIRPVKRIAGAKLALNWALLILVAFGALAKISGDLLPENVDKVQSELLPLDMVAYLREDPPQGNIFNSYNWGGLLVFALPDMPVFVDGRTDLYGDELLSRYFRAYLGASDWRDVLVEYDIDTVILETESALSTLLREEGTWEIIFEDDQAVVFEMMPDVE